MRHAAKLTLAVATLAALACTRSEPGLTREQVLPLLQEEAARMKAEGEDVPDVGVSPTWTIVAVEVVEQPGNEAQPFAGTVRFKIESRSHSLEGPRTDSFEKKFEYVYDAERKQWVFRM